MKKQARNVSLAISLVILIILGISYWSFCEVLSAETNVRYTGLRSLLAAQVSKTIVGMEISAANVFNEVERHLDSSQSAVEALKRESNLNPDVRGYFAAFEPNFFEDQGKWFEPYYHHSDDSDYELTQVGSARHDYTKVSWYIRAKVNKKALWSDPYYYDDGTSISGHYCTYVKPLYDYKGDLACVCGADITFNWLGWQLGRIDSLYRHSELFSQHKLMSDSDFFSAVLYKDGTCLTSSNGKHVVINNARALDNFSNRLSGVVDIMVGDVPSVLYYAPLEGLDWSVGVVVPRSEIRNPFIFAGIAFAVLAILGILISLMICRRIPS